MTGRVNDRRPATLPATACGEPETGLMVGRGIRVWASGDPDPVESGVQATGRLAAWASVMTDRAGRDTMPDGSMSSDRVLGPGTAGDPWTATRWITVLVIDRVRSMRTCDNRGRDNTPSTRLGFHKILARGRIDRVGAV
jgi:hypothetical protein